MTHISLRNGTQFVNSDSDRLRLSDDRERHLLGAMLAVKDKGKVRAVVGSAVDVDDFRVHAHQVLFTAIVACAARGPCGPVDVAEYMKREGSLAELGDSPYSSVAGMIELTELDPFGLDLEDSARKVRQNAAFRRRILALELALQEARRPGDTAEIIRRMDERIAAATQEKTSANAGWQYKPISAADLARGEFRPVWLIENVLVADQPAVFGGPQKSLKTNVGIDLAVSLGSGTPFLGKFAVPTKKRVLFLSGESGSFTIQETAKRICDARNIDLENDADVSFIFDLPRLSNANDLNQFAAGVRRDGVQVAIIDPLYISLLAGAVNINAANVFDMGPLLRQVAKTLLDAGCTPVLVHHTNRNGMRKNDEALDLGDLAFAGIAEFARQWLLINRREAFEPGQPNQMRLVVGGSVGHSGVWALDIDEGHLQEDFSGRIWDVQVRSIYEAQQESRRARDAEKNREKEENQAERDREFLAALDEMDPDGQGCGVRKLRDRLKWKTDVTRQVVERLVRSGILKEIPVTSAIGNGGKRTAEGVQRRGTFGDE